MKEVLLPSKVCLKIVDMAADIRKKLHSDLDLQCLQKIRGEIMIKGGGGFPVV